MTPTERCDALNSRVKRELRRIGYAPVAGAFPERMKFADVTPRLLYLLTDHGDRVDRRTPAGRLKARKGR